MKDNRSGFCILQNYLKIPFLVICILALTLSLYANTIAQAKVNLNFKNVTFKDLFLEIQKQTKLSFVFNADQLNTIGRVEIKVENESVNVVLDRILGSTPYTYSMEGQTIVIIPRQKQSPQGQQQYRSVTIKGKVTDSDGIPLVGATVRIYGTTIGTAADEKGEYKIVVGENQNELMVSYIGYINQVVKVDGKTVLNFVMREDQRAIEEVVVTGYQNIKRERMTGSSTTINATELRNKGLTSMDEYLNGTISGLTSISSGRPGEDAKIMIRGVNSLTGSTDPIWIVDGMPLQGEIPNIAVGTTNLQSTIFTSGIGNIAPDDIESITVLKDAAATAIYGARAANGVIVIKTKTGLAGKTRFNITANYGITERPVNNIDMMNTQQKIQFEREVYADDAGGYLDVTSGRVVGLLYNVDRGLISKVDAEKEIARLENIHTDWFKELFRTAATGQYNFSMSGGSEKTQHYVSLNYLTEKGTQLNNKMNRLGMNLKLTHNPVKQVRINGGLAATIKNDRISASNIDPLKYAMYANPYERPYKEDGSADADLSYNASLSKIRDGFKWDKFNAIDDLNRNTNTSRYLDAELTLKVEWEILPGLMFTTHGIYNANSNHNRISEGANTYTNFVNNWYTYNTEITHDMVRGSLREATGYSNSYTFRNTLQYSAEFAEKHFITLFAGQEISERTSYNSYNYSPIYDSEHRIVGFPEMDGVNANEVNYGRLGGTGKSVSKLSSFFANGSYSFMDRYILTGAIRYDGSDIIGNNNQFTPLWNVGARWNLHRENFMQSMSFIDELSLRAGFGYTGSIDKNALPFVVMTLGQSILYDGLSVPTGFTYPNPNVKWQTKQDFNLGINLALWDRKIELGVNYYNNITRDVLDSKALAASSGRIDVTENVANILNRGVEIDLGFTLVQRHKVQWYIKANAAFNHNELSKTYYQELKDLPVRTRVDGNAFVEGYPVGGWFGFRFAGVDPVTGNTLVYNDKNEKIDAENLRNTTLNQEVPTMTYLGKQHPNITGGFSTTVNFDRFIFSTNFEFKAGHKIRSFNTFRNLDSRNRHVNDVNRWRQVGDVTEIPAASTMSSAYSKYMYDVALEKGDYLRCSFMSLGYNLDSHLLSKIGFSNARLSFTVKDLFTVSKYNGIDPTLMGNFGYPNSRKYTISLNVGF